MKKYILIIAAVFLLGSCSKNFLDRYPQTQIAPQLYFNTESDLSMYINGLLDNPGYLFYVNSNEQSTDNYATTGNVTMKSILTGNITSANAPSGWSVSNWGRLKSINYFLDNYSKAKITDDIKNHYAGLARYYRAKFYMDKVKNYSDVPWYSHMLYTSDSSLLYKPSDPRTLVVDSIFADLDFAVAHVRKDVPTGTPGLWAIKTMYARMALYEGTYRKYHPELNLQSTAGKYLDMAKKQAGDVMGAGFSLADDYSSLFTSQTLNGNKEVILNTEYDYSKGYTGSGNGEILDYEQSPSKDLLQTYLMKDGSRYTDIPGYQQKQFVAEFVNRDPRLPASYMYPGFVRSSGNVTTPYVQQLNTSFTGYHQLKGYQNGTSDSKIINSVDVPVLRYAEVLLTYVEAAAENGTLTQTDVDNTVNKLRTRVAMPALSMAAANANPDPVLAAKFPDVSGVNKGVILEIRRERRVEFAFEGLRYDDLMRWHAGPTGFAPYQQGLYFPGPGQYDLTGDGIPDIMLITSSTPYPAEADKVKNSLGVTLVYYKMGVFGDQNASVFFQNGDAGGPIVTGSGTRTFVEPKYYYRPIPVLETTQNPGLKQPFGWQ